MRLLSGLSVHTVDQGRVKLIVVVEKNTDGGRTPPLSLATSGAPLPRCSAPLGIASPRAAPRDFIVRWQRSAAQIVTF